jgi:hypothetical protein
MTGGDVSAVTGGVAALTVTDGTLFGLIMSVLADGTLAVDVLSTFALDDVAREEFAVRRFVEPPLCVVFEALVEAEEEPLGRPLGGPEGVR